MDIRKIQEGVKLIEGHPAKTPERPGPRRTPERVSEMYEEIFSGISFRQPEELQAPMEGEKAR